MSDFPPDIIIDANGDPVGRYRRNQDPSEAQRLHPVPRTNAWGEVIMDGDKPEVQMLPLDHPKVAEQLEKEGRMVHEDGIHIVAIPGHPDTDIQPTEQELADAQARLEGKKED